MALTIDRIEEGLRPTRVLVTDLPLPEEPSHFENATSDRQVNLRCEVVRDFNRLKELSSDWSRLWKADPKAEIFQSPEWAIAWWRSFGGHNSLCSIVVYEGDEVIGILPLVLRHERIHFLGTPDADYADIVCSEERAPYVLAAALESLSDSVTGWKECVLEHLSEKSRVARYYQHLPRSLGARLYCVPTEQYQIIASRDTNDRAFDSLLGKHHTRRRRNKLQKAGETRFHYYETAEEAESHLSDFFRHHVRRFAATGRQSRCASPDFQQFLRSLVEELGPAQGLRFGALELDGRPLAWYFGFEANSKFLLYQHTFDLDASDFTPGELLLWNLLAYAKDRSIREFDFGTGDELYKSRFSTEQRKTFSMFFEPRRLGGRIRGLRRGFQSALQPLRGQLRQATRNRTTMRAFRAARMWTMGTIAGIQRADRRGVLAQYTRHFLNKLIQDAVWSQQSMDVFATDALCPQFAPIAGNGSSHLEIDRLLFGDLVELAWEHPDVLLPSDLPRCRKRLKTGDRAYVARNQSGLVMMCWTSTTVAGAVAPGAGVPADSPVTLIDEAWSARNNAVIPAYQLLLSSLATEECSSPTASAPAYWGSNQPQLRNVLRRQGYAPRFKITRYKALGRFHGESVRLHQS